MFHEKPDEELLHHAMPNVSKGPLIASELKNSKSEEHSGTRLRTGSPGPPMGRAAHSTIGITLTPTAPIIGAPISVTSCNGIISTETTPPTPTMLPSMVARSSTGFRVYMKPSLANTFMPNWIWASSESIRISNERQSNEYQHPLSYSGTLFYKIKTPTKCETRLSSSWSARSQDDAHCEFGGQ